MYSPKPRGRGAPPPGARRGRIPRKPQKHGVYHLSKENSPLGQPRLRGVQGIPAPQVGCVARSQELGTLSTHCTATEPPSRRFQKRSLKCILNVFVQYIHALIVEMPQSSKTKSVCFDKTLVVR